LLFCESENPGRVQYGSNIRGETVRHNYTQQRTVYQWFQELGEAATHSQARLSVPLTAKTGVRVP